jgi:hypothetical protein
MNNIKAYLYSADLKNSSLDKWDYGLIKELLDKNKIEQVVVDSLPKTDRAFVVIPGPQNYKLESKVNKELKKINRVVLFVNGDEQGLFNLKKINHKNIEIWTQYSQEKHRGYNLLPQGCPQHFKEMIPKYTEKKYDIFFSGQNTHTRRKELVKVLSKIKTAICNPTSGFTQGFPLKEYYEYMSLSKIVPCPAGTISIDSFRLYEAIELLCLPIGDEVDSKNEHVKYFDFIFKNFLFPTVKNWESLNDNFLNWLEQYPNNMHQVVAWWIKYKRDLAIKIMEQVNE